MANEEIVLRINPIMETGDVKKAVDQIEGFFNQMNLSGSMKSDVAKIFKDMRGEAESFERASKEAFKTPGEVKNFEKSGQRLSGHFEKLVSVVNRLGSEDLSKLFTIDDSKIAGMTQEVTRLQQKINSLTAAEFDKISNSIKQMHSVSKSGNIDAFLSSLKSGNFSGAENALKGLIQNLQAFKGSSDETRAGIELMLQSLESGKIDDLKGSFEMLQSSLEGSEGSIKTYAASLGQFINLFSVLSSNGDIQKTVSEIQQLEGGIGQIRTERFQQLGQEMSQLPPKIQKCNNEFDQMSQELTSAARHSQELNREISEVGQRATYFLSLENSIDLFRQGVRKAIDTVKELDAAMAETAVVTDFNIGDMWDKLPEYTQMANELGVATQGVYEASTLYYQQGLQTEQVMALTAETLKMARIAGLECADATNLMTAALRGFNMEINETSAQRVNDVYSELAAITAADTNEIATAMTKTASIASSANMELETTAALLAQMIETTREPAETAGTAMKTIVARFTEMKKAVSDVVTVEGEEVSVNKVDAALASVGVSLKNANGEFRNLDDVLLELASKWNSLDIMSQRYIATTAAGSRQQSRFIAMMQDYDRTMQLVDAAYNSAGSSSKQFEKTQESLESKLARLENAWNTFLMGIADDKIIKTLVDALTGLLNAYNNLTSGADGVFGSAVRLGTVFAGLRLAKLGVDKLVAHFVNLKSSITGAAGAAQKLTFLEVLTQKINNFKMGRGFVIDADIDTKGFDAKVTGMQTRMAAFEASLKDPVIPQGVITGFTVLDGKLTTTVLTAEGALETIEVELDETTFKALTAAAAADEVGDEISESGISGKVALDLLEKEYDELILRMIAAKAAGDMDAFNSLSLRAQELNKVQRLLGSNKGTWKGGFDALKTSVASLLPLLGKLAIVLGVVAAVIAACYAAWYYSEDQRRKRSIENLTSASELLRDSLEKTTQQTEELTKTWEELSAKEDSLEGLIQGSQEWHETLVGINTTVTDLISKYPQLAEALTIDENGKMSIDETAIKNLESDLEVEGLDLSLTSNLTKSNSEYQASLSNIRERMYQFSGSYSGQERKKTTEGQTTYDEDSNAYELLYNEVIRNALVGRKVAQMEADTDNYYQDENNKYSTLDSSKGAPLFYDKKTGKWITVGLSVAEGWAEENAKKNGTITLRQIEKEFFGEDSEEYKAIYGESKITDEQWIQIFNKIKETEGIENYIAPITAGTNPKGEKQNALAFMNELESAYYTRMSQDKAYYQAHFIAQGYDEQIANAAAGLAAKRSGAIDAKLEEYGNVSFEDTWKGGMLEGELSDKAVAQGMRYDKDKNVVYSSSGIPLYTIDYNGKANKEAFGETTTISNEEFGRLLATMSAYTEENGVGVAEFFGNNPEFAKVINGDLSLEDNELPKFEELIDNKDYYTKEEFESKINAYKDAQNKQFETLIGGYNLLMEEGGKYIREEVKLNGSGELEGSDLNKIKNNVRKAYSQQSLAMAKILEEEAEVFGQDFSAAVTAVYLDLSALEKMGANEAKKVIDSEKDSQELSYGLYNAGVSAKELQGTLEKLDGSSAIKTAKTLHNEIENGNKAAAALKLFMESSEDSFISAGKQIKELLSSEAFADGLKDLNAIYAQTGEITSDNVREIAEEYSLLNDIIDLGTIKASAFAEMMEDVSSNEISLLDITDDLAKAYNTLYYSADLAGDAIARLKKVEIGDSDTELGKIYTESWTALKDLSKRGAVGDSQIDKYMEQLVGKGKWQEALFDKGSRIEAIKAIDEQYYLSKNQGNLSGSFKALLREHGTTGNYFTLDGNNDVNWDLSGIKDTEELINKLANDFDITEEYASALVADLKTYSDTFGIVLDKIDKASGYADFINSRATKDEKGNVNINASETELKVLAKALGKTVDELKTEVTQNAKDNAKAKSVTFQQREKGEYGYTYTTKNETTGNKEMHYSPGAKDKITTDLKDKGMLAGKEKLTVTGKLTGIFDTSGKIVNQKYLDNLLAIDGVREILLKASVDDSYKEEAKRLLDDLGLGSISAQLLSGESLSYVSAYADVLGTDMYNAMVVFLRDFATLLEEQTYTIPITWIPGPLATLMELVGIEPKNGGGKIVIGGASGGFSGSVIETKGYSDSTIEIITESQNPSDDEEEGTDPYDDDPTNGGDSGGSEDEYEPINPHEYNAQQGLEGLEYDRYINSREEELIGKLPEEIQGPLKLANLGEKMIYEAQEIGYNQQLADIYKNDMAQFEAQAEYGQYYDYNEDDMSYQYSDQFMAEYENMSLEKRQAIDEEIAAANEVATKYREVAKELEGGKIQKVFKETAKHANKLSDAFKDNKNMAQIMTEAFEDTALEDLKYFSNGIGKVIDKTGVLEKEFKGLGLSSEKASDMIGSLEELTGIQLGDSTKEAIGMALGQGGTGQQWGSALSGMAGDFLGGMSGLMNFDMMTMGLDGLNMGMDMFGQMKDMASQMIQYVVQFVTTVINWWINREDWLYNLLSAIEQEVHNFNRQEQVEERFRLYSDEGLDDLVSAWEAMRQSLEKQIDLNEQLIKSRQAELQFLNLTNLPFSPAFYYDYTEERVIENPWVYDIYVLLLDLGAMLPEIGQIFSSIKQLMEDNKKRMEDAVKEIEDAREEILELEKKQLELRTKYMEDEIELEELVMDSIIEKQQEEIDELSAMNDAISEGNEKLINTLNSKLDLIRQQRDNEDKEEELGEKERRLAYLRQDTSNANRKEIMDLKDELEDERRSYTDELIDQKISALEEQNERAAEQRQKQIDLLQAQLDHTEKYGLQWAEAQTLIKNGFDSEGRLRVGTDLFDMLMSKEDFTSMGLGSTRQVKQIMDWNVTSIAAAAFREINDIWDEGFGNFEMSNDVHDQSRLHLWADREVDYRQLPSWLSFLQPAYNAVQDYFWRTGNNIGAFAETAWGSGKNSTSILGKTIVPLLQEILGTVKGKYEEYNSLSVADGYVETTTGVIANTMENVGYDWGERIIKTFGNGFAAIGDTFTEGVRAMAQSNSFNNQTSTQSIGDITVQVHIDNEDTEDGYKFGENIANAFREGLSNLSIFK